jgi:hypothetical protein
MTIPWTPDGHHSSAFLTGQGIEGAAIVGARDEIFEALLIAPTTDWWETFRVFRKQFLSKRFSQMASTSENQQVAVSIASGFLERLSGMASPSAGRKTSE